MIKVLIKKLNPSVELPSYKTNGASGMDLMAFLEKPINLEPGKSCLVSTGLSVAFPKEYEIQIRPRSGLWQKISYVLNTPGKSIVIIEVSLKLFYSIMVVKIS